MNRVFKWNGKIRLAGPTGRSGPPRYFDLNGFSTDIFGIIGIMERALNWVELFL